MSHAAQYSSIDTQELQKLLELATDPMIKLLILSELKKRSEAKAIVETIKIATKLNLPGTDSEHCPLPNLFLRSNLFNASKTHGKSDTPIRNYEITCYQPGKEQLLVTAYRQFNQSDLDLLLVLIKLQQEQKSNLLQISTYQLTKLSTGFDGKNQYESVKEQLELMINANIKIQIERYSFVGGIINNAYFDDKEQLYIIELNPKFQPLFSENNWTSLDVNIRNRLKSNLAKWLYGFYSSHKNSATPIKTETIYKLCGASVKRFDKWVELTLIKALKELKTAYTQNAKFFNYELKADLLYVKKSSTKAQLKNPQLKRRKEYRK